MNGIGTIENKTTTKPKEEKPINKTSPKKRRGRPRKSKSVKTKTDNKLKFKSKSKKSRKNEPSINVNEQKQEKEQPKKDTNKKKERQDKRIEIHIKPIQKTSKSIKRKNSERRKRVIPVIKKEVYDEKVRFLKLHKYKHRHNPKKVKSLQDNLEKISKYIIV